MGVTLQRHHQDEAVLFTFWVAHVSQCATWQRVTEVKLPFGTTVEVFTRFMDLLVKEEIPTSMDVNREATHSSTSWVGYTVY